ncbi:TPM domain-containing protein [Panacibacter ginsenosidivorans]|uniref:TPM domain-containing protein n=1 Tax=Panacibacter ginsenosidivorans TaxID=1813871 RepID=A0A5B8V3R7_9BACT|nr:TPM domain-containing protein [Panacibacter ginsenosidivorans]QEC65808.1 TPM domain-containing protein [Panacibacter ginsenosidivorans]
MFGLFRKKTHEFFSAPEKEKILAAINEAERNTSGEVRVYIESRCSYVDPIDRAMEIFYSLKMDATELHNGVLVYVAMKDRQLAIFADEGIYKKASAAFWKEEVSKMLSQFNKENYADGIATVVKEIGELLHANFPYDADTDKNELPDDIVFGK